MSDIGGSGHQGSEIRRLGSKGREGKAKNNLSSVEAEPTKHNSSFGVEFESGERNLSEDEKKSQRKTSLKAIYGELTGNSPDDASEDDLIRGIVSHFEGLYGKKVKVIIIIHVMDPKNLTNSYITALKRVGEFHPNGQKSLVDDAISHLGTLDSSKQDERKALQDALEKTGRGGYLNKEQCQAFETARINKDAQRITTTPERGARTATDHTKSEHASNTSDGLAQEGRRSVSARDALVESRRDERTNMRLSR